MKKKESYNSIDIMRVICAIMVVVIHIPPFGSIERFDTINYYLQQYVSRVAVPFFFITSGFFLAKKNSIDNFDIKLSIKYIKKILILYLIWSLIYFPAAYINTIKTSGFLYYLRIFIFTGSYDQLWYLPSVAVSTLIISLLLWKKVPIKKILIIAGVFYTCGLLTQSYFGLIKPLESIFPHVYNVLRIIKKIILTTRNGVFYGMIFVSIGMLFGFNKINIKFKKSLIGFITCYLLMLVEVIVLTKLNFIREHDINIFVVPTALFLFSLCLNIKLKDNSIYSVCRKFSALIFYTHMMMNFIMCRVIDFFHISYNYQFLLVLFSTVIVDILILQISKINKLKWIEKLYT